MGKVFQQVCEREGELMRQWASEGRSVNEIHKLTYVGAIRYELDTLQLWSLLLWAG